MMREMAVRTEGGALCTDAPAKVNLFLEIVGKRADGFHDLVSVFQTLPLHDTLCVRPSAELTLTCDVPALPTDASNLVLRAAQALREEAGVTQGATFALQKRIPDGGGLGGGSSDAAAALVLCNELWGLGWSREQLAQVGATVGSDVAFFLYGGVCLCTGRGEVVEPLPHLRPLPLTLAIPPWKVPTPLAYRSLDPARFNQRSVDDCLSTLAELQQAREGGDQQTESLWERFHAASFNRFEEAVFRLEPRQKQLQDALTSTGARARMSGSGSCCWLVPGKTVPASLVPGVRIIAMS